MKLLFLFCVAACISRGPSRPDAALPSCASLGCPDKPSGDPHVWEPCSTDVCYCPVGSAGSAAECSP